MENSIKFVWNGIQVNGTLYKGSYSTGPYTEASGLPEGTVTVYMDRSNTPRVPGLEIKNDSDIITDYFENDTVRVRPGTVYFEAAKAASNAYEIHFAKQAVKSAEKALARHIGTHTEEFYQCELQQRRERLTQLESAIPKKTRSEPCR